MSKTKSKKAKGAAPSPVVVMEVLGDVDTSRVEIINEVRTVPPPIPPAPPPLPQPAKPTGSWWPGRLLRGLYPRHKRSRK